MNNEEVKSGFLGLVGPSNSGKSTLLNAIIGQRVSIVSPKPQTTMRSVRGILDSDDCQLVFVDTPGLHRRSETLMKGLTKVARGQASDCDDLLWVFDVSKKGVLGQIQALSGNVSEWKSKEKSICILNKVDLIEKEQLLPMIQTIAGLNIFDEIVPISAKKGMGVSEVVSLLSKRADDGVRFYERDQTSDRPKEFLVAEYVREKIYETTREEIPYSVYTEVEHWDESGELPKIYMRIIVDSESRKGIVIGKGGKMLKEIGTRSRKAIEQYLGKKVFLKLHVEVIEGWKNDKDRVQKYLEL